MAGTRLGAEESTIASFNYQYDDIIDDDINIDSIEESNLLKVKPLINNMVDLGQEKAKKIFSSQEVSKNLVEEESDFRTLIENRKLETNDLRYWIVCVGLLMISIGVMANLLFNLLIVCRKRKRQTSTTLIMFSMCFAYLIYLTFFSLKMTIYFNGENLLKFHIYDTIDNWTYGSFLCHFISGLPICCKLISRLSIFTIVLRRFLFLLLNIENERSFDFYDKRFNSNDSKQNSKQNEHSLLKKVFRKLFEWPFVILVIALIWLISIIATWPMFSSYKYNEILSVCDSVFSFPDDIKSINFMYFNYMIYALILPCMIIFVLLFVLFVLESNWFKRRCSSTSSPCSSTDISFDEVPKGYTCFRAKSSNFMLWLMFSIHFSSSIPQELYRYMELRVDLTNESMLDSYLTSILTQPFQKAKPYYALQLIYSSEFVIMPLVFLLFFTFSNLKRKLNKNSDVNIISSGSIFDHLIACFYESELCKSNKSNIKFLKIYKQKSRSSELHISNDSNGPHDALLSVNNINLDSFQQSKPAINGANKSLKPTPFEMAANLTTSEHCTNSNSGNVNANINNNVVHIIQHPSWRINIKQHSPPINNQISSNRLNTFNQEANIQLPFNYLKTNLK
jgi:hypothetical protein